ncbi:MAG: DUF5618 family protein [Bacteroidota bacterium]
MLTENKTTAQKKYDEAIRFMSNARKELQQAKKNGKFYHDKKHLSVACGIAYKSVLKALEGFFILRNIANPKGRVSIQYYQSHLATLDKKMLDYLNSAYQILHLYGYYDELNNVKIIQAGFEEAQYIIHKLKQSL